MVLQFSAPLPVYKICLSGNSSTIWHGYLYTLPNGILCKNRERILHCITVRCVAHMLNTEHEWCRKGGRTHLVCFVLIFFSTFFYSTPSDVTKLANKSSLYYETSVAEASGEGEYWETACTQRLIIQSIAIFSPSCQHHEYYQPFVL